MIENLKMTINYGTGTWWLPGRAPARFYMEARPHSLPKPIIENTTSDSKKATKTNKEDSNRIMENKINSNNKILTSVNNRIKSETKGRENNTEESKPKFGGKIQLKSQQTKFEEIVKSKIPELGTELKQTHLTQHKIDFQGHDPIKQ